MPLGGVSSRNVQACTGMPLAWLASITPVDLPVLSITSAVLAPSPCQNGAPGLAIAASSAALSDTSITTGRSVRASIAFTKSGSNDWMKTGDPAAAMPCLPSVARIASPMSGSVAMDA